MRERYGYLIDGGLSSKLLDTALTVTYLDRYELRLKSDLQCSFCFLLFFLSVHFFPSLFLSDLGLKPGKYREQEIGSKEHVVDQA